MTQPGACGSHSKCGTVGTLVEGERDAATLTVLRTPLGSLRTPGFAGPNGIPLMAEFPAPADPAIDVPTMLWADAGIGPFERRRQYLGIVAAGFRIVLQFTIGHDRSRVQATSQKPGTALNPPKHPAPSDQEVIAAIQSTAAYLSKVAGDEKKELAPMPHAKLTACSSVSPAPTPAFAARPKLRSRPRWFTISTSFATASRPTP
jgi:hypothetical protein